MSKSLQQARQLPNVRVHVIFEGAKHSKPYFVRDVAQAHAYALADFPGCQLVRVEAVQS